jgi:hypothetical protein
VHPAAARLHDGSDRPTPSVTIICGRYCADSPPACVLDASVIATYSPGVVASIQGQEPALNQDVELRTEEAPSKGAAAAERSLGHCLLVPYHPAGPTSPLK